MTLIQAPSVQWSVGVILALLADIVGNVGVQILKIAHGKITAKQNDAINIVRHPSITGSALSLSVPLHPHPIIPHTDQMQETLLPPPINEDAEMIINGTTSSNSPSKHIQKHKQIKPSSKEKKKMKDRYICDPLWIIGTVFQFAGSLLDFVAVGFAPQSVVAPIGSLVVVINLIFTPLFQREIPSKKIIFITSFVVFGSMITTAFSPKHHENYDNVQEVVELYSTAYFWFYCIVIALTLIIMTIFHKWCKKYKAKYSISYERKWFKWHRFTVGALSGIMGAQNILFAKGVSTMIVFSIADKHNLCFLYWEWYILLISMLLSVWFQLKWLNYGLKYFSPMQIIPIFQSFWTIIGILGGLIVYQEFEDFKNTRNQFVFSLGCIIIVAGILYLTTLDRMEKFGGELMKSINEGSNEHNINDIVSVITNSDLNHESSRSDLDELIKSGYDHEDDGDDESEEELVLHTMAPGHKETDSYKVVGPIDRL